MPPTTTLKPSRYLAIFLILTQLGAISSILATPFPLYLKLLLTLIATIYTGQAFLKDVMLHSPKAVLNIAYLGANLWQLTERSQKRYPAVLTGDTTILNFALVLRFKSKKYPGKKTVVIFKDSVDTQRYHHLLMILGSTKIDYEVNP